MVRDLSISNPLAILTPNPPQFGASGLLNNHFEGTTDNSPNLFPVAQDTYISNSQNIYTGNVSILNKMKALLELADNEGRSLTEAETRALIKYNKQLSGIASEEEIKRQAASENTQVTDTNVLNTLAPFYERNRIDPKRDGKGEELSLLATNAMEDIYKRALIENRSLTAQESYDVSQYQKQIAVAQNFMKNSEAANKEWQIYALGNDGLASSG